MNGKLTAIRNATARARSPAPRGPDDGHTDTVVRAQPCLVGDDILVRDWRGGPVGAAMMD